MLTLFATFAVEADANVDANADADAEADADANTAVSLCVAAAKINYDIMIYKISRKWCGLFSCYSLSLHPPL